MNGAIRNGTAALAAALLAIPAAGLAEEHEEQAGKDLAALAHAMGEAKVSLERGVSASAREGRPISAKYELEDGKLQLSVYTMKGDAFSEVIVDHATGKVAKSEAIATGDDYREATEQKEAMAKAKRSLQAAIADAAKKNRGYRAVSAIPQLEKGHPVAKVMLLKGDDWRTVSVRLDGPK